MKISDKDFDKLISVAISQISDDDNVELKTDEELRSEGSSAHEFSSAFKKQMKKLIRENQKQQFTTYRTKRFRSRIRIAILVAVLVCAATMFSVNAFRTSIVNFIFSSSSESSSFAFDKGTTSISSKLTKYLPTYTPKGFGVEAIQKLSDNSIYIQIIYVFLTIFLYLLKCPQSLILSALRAFCFCGKSHISRSIFLYFRYQSWLKSW